VCLACPTRMFDREAATLALDGSPPIPRITFPTCRAHYPGGSSGCSCRLLPRSHGLPPMAGVRASSAFRPVVCENIPNIAPHIAANIRMGMVCLRLHSEHQLSRGLLSRGLRSSIQNRSSTNISLYKIAHCNPLRSKLVCLIQKTPIPDHTIIE
jgi:hypothetical protein